MSRYRVHFNAIQYANGGGKSTASASITVEAESESTAITLATNKMMTNSTYRGREIVMTKIEKLR